VYYKQIYKSKVLRSNHQYLCDSLSSFLIRIAEIEASMATEDFYVLEQIFNTEKNTQKLYLKLKNEMKVMLLTRDSFQRQVSVALDIHIGNFYYISMHFYIHVNLETNYSTFINKDKKRIHKNIYRFQTLFF